MEDYTESMALLELCAIVVVTVLWGNVCANISTILIIRKDRSKGLLL